MKMNAQGPLAGLKILDLTCMLSGPLGTCWLSDMGASVIKVENPEGGGDYTRQCGPFVNGCSTYYATLNRNKKCVTLNLKTQAGKQIFLDLVKQVDVVTENFRPGVIEKLGLGYEVLKSVNEKIILASISGYGATGPYSSRPGFDVISQAMGGIMSLTGFEDQPPTKCGPSIGDVGAGIVFTSGILAALYCMEKTGQGQRLELSLVDTVLALTTQDYIDYGHTKQLPQRLGNNYSLWCPYGTYKAKDRYYTIGVGTEKQWQAFCVQVLHRPELLDDPRFNTQPARVRNRADVDDLVNGWACQLRAAEVIDILSEAVIPAALVYDFADIEADENFTVHREMIRHMQHPTIGDFSYINMPVRFSETKLVAPSPAGALGEHNTEILGQYLGLEEATLERLQREGVI